MAIKTLVKLAKLMQGSVYDLVAYRDVIKYKYIVNDN